MAPIREDPIFLDIVRTHLKNGETLPQVDEIRTRVKIGAPIQNDITVEAWLRRWLAAKTDLRAATRTSYASIIDIYLVPLLGEHRVDRLRPGHIKEAMNEIAASVETITASNAERHRLVALSKKAWREHDAATARAARAKLKEMPPFRRPPNAATVQRIRGVLRAALTDACHEQIVTINVAKLVKLPSGKAPKGLIWTPGRIVARHSTASSPPR